MFLRQHRRKTARPLRRANVSAKTWRRWLPLSLPPGYSPGHAQAVHVFGFRTTPLRPRLRLSQVRPIGAAQPCCPRDARQRRAAGPPYTACMQLVWGSGNVPDPRTGSHPSRHCLGERGVTHATGGPRRDMGDANDWSLQASPRPAAREGVGPFSLRQSGMAPVLPDLPSGQ